MNARRWFTRVSLGLVALGLAPVVAHLTRGPSITYSAKYVYRAYLRVIAGTLEKCAARHDGCYPNELWQLQRRDTDGVYCLATIPRDPRRARSVYLPPLAPGTRPLLSSLGIDGIAGTADDILPETGE